MVRKMEEEGETSDRGHLEEIEEEGGVIVDESLDSYHLARD